MRIFKLLCVYLLAANIACSQDTIGGTAVAGKVSRLLKELDELQTDRQAGQDEWAKKMRELIELGPDATPSLSLALDKTPRDKRLMLRSIPFLMRGIGDARAVPSLIRNLPKSFGRDGSDMGYDTQDKELLAFMRKHDDDLKDRDPKGYNWGRPINEFRTAIQKLTGQDHGLTDLCFVSDRPQSSPRSRHLKEVLYHTFAARCADWWEQNWKRFTKDAKYSKVKLRPLETDSKLTPLDRTRLLQRVSGSSNKILQSVFEKSAGRVFLDLDTGRHGGVHSRWAGKVNEKNSRLIAKWAVSQGFDLMGSEVQHEGKTIYVLQLLGGEAWEIDFEDWKDNRYRTASEWIKRGRRLTGRLTVQKRDREEDLRGTGAFFVITREGTPLLIYLGVEVHDTNVKVGSRASGDRQLSPTHFYKGRRFAVRILGEKPKQK